jgi:broad specificity phosphatase PhoE
MPNFTKEIFIIRHGETEYNRLGIVQGSGVNSDLNEKGQMQANAFFEKYKDYSFDKIYTSKLKRTHQSVQKFIDSGSSWQQHVGLNEISWGKREGRVPDLEDNSSFIEITEKWQNGETNMRLEDGESPEEVANRIQAFFEEILSFEHEKRILIAMHGRALKILLSKLLLNDLSKMDTFEHTNLCLYILHYNYNSRQFLLKLKNDTSHLN